MRGLRDAAALMLVSGPSLFAISQGVSKMKDIDPFFVLGIISLLSMLVADRYPEVMSILFVSTVSALSIFMMGNFPPFLALASGYIFILPLFILLASYLDSSPQSFTLIYFFSLLIAIYLIQEAATGTLTPAYLFYPTIFYRVTGSRPQISPGMDFVIFGILVAASLIALLWGVASRTSFAGYSTLLDRGVLSAGIAASTSSLGLVFFSKYLGMIGGDLAVAIAIAASILLVIYLRRIAK